MIPGFKLRVVECWWAMMPAQKQADPFLRCWVKSILTCKSPTLMGGKRLFLAVKTTSQPTSTRHHGRDSRGGGSAAEWLCRTLRRPFHGPAGVATAFWRRVSDALRRNGCVVPMAGQSFAAMGSLPCLDGMSVGCTEQADRRTTAWCL